MKNFLPSLKTMSVLFMLMIGVAFINRAYGQIPIVYYDFESNSSRTTFFNGVNMETNAGTSSSITRNASVNIAGTTGAGIAYYSGIAAGEGAASVGWSPATADPGVAATTYYQFSVSTLGFTGTSFQFDLIDNSRLKIGMLYSVNGGTTWLSAATGSNPGNATWNTFGASLPSAADNLSNLMIRIYGYDASSATTTALEIDNLIILESSTTATAGSKTLINYSDLYSDATGGTPANLTSGNYFIWAGNFTVTGSGTTVTLSNANTALANTGNFLGFNNTPAAYGITVSNSGTLILAGGTNEGVVAGVGTFTNSPGTNILIGDVNGITSGTTLSGNVQVTGTRTFNAAANYTYNATAAQVTGNGLPATLTGAFTINNSAGVTLSQSTVNTAGTITLTSGNLSLSTFNLTAASSNISGVSASQYIQTNSTGQLGVTVGSSGVFFPVGNSTYDPITLSNSGTADLYGINVLDGTFATPYDATRVLNRRWQVTKASTTAAGTITATAQFNGTDPSGSNFPTSSPGATYIGFYNSASWVQNTATTGTGTVTGSTTYSGGTFGLTNLSASPEYFALGKDNSLVSPLSTLTTVNGTAISNTGAGSGGTGLSQGASSITAKGVVWNTTTNPTLPGLGSTNDGSGTTSYTSTLASLSPQTQYYVSAYATNSYGTGYGTVVSFYTLSNPATVQASGLSASAGNAQAILNWTGASFPATGATQGGYLLIYLSGSTPALVASPNGLAPASAVSTGFIVATTATSLPSAPAVTATQTGLTNGTTYTFLLIPYTWDGTHAATYNYLVAGAQTVTATPVAAPAITTTTAISNVTNTGMSSGGSGITGTGITAEGVVWNTSTAPTLPGLGSTNDGTGTIPYASTLTGLSPQKRYYVRAYVTSPGGTGYATTVNSFTLSNPVTANASGFTATPNSSTQQIALSWTGATFPTSGATQGGYLLVYTADGTTPTLTASPNGGAPPAAVSNGTIFTTTATVLPALPATTATLTSLINGTTYQFLLVPYTWNGTNNGTYDYGTPTVLSLTTCAVLSPTVPTGLSFGTPTTTTIPGSTTGVASPGTSSGYTIFYSTTNTTPVPVNGSSYNLAGSPYTIGGVSYYAIDQTTAGAFTASGLASNTPYYFFVYSYTSTTCGTITPVYSAADVSGNATTLASIYYSGSTGLLSSTTSWWTNSNGTGNNPPNFTTAGITYNIINNATPLIGGSWAVSGTGSIINVGDGGSNKPTFVIGSNSTLTTPVLNVLAGSTVYISSTVDPAVISGSVTLAATSTVNFASSSAQTIGAYNYGNLISSSTGARTLASSGTIGVAGTFTPGTNTYTIIGSTIKFNSTGQTIPAFNYYNLTNTNNITLSPSGIIGIEGIFTPGGTYTVSGSTVNFNALSGDAAQTIPLISSGDLGSGNNAGGYYNLTVSSALTTYMPYITGTSALGNIIPIFGALNCSGTGQVVFNNAVTAGNVNTYYIGSFSSSATAGIINLGSLAGAGTSVINVYGNFVSNGGTLYTASTGNNAIVNFTGSSSSPQQFACASARQVWFYITNGAVVNMTGPVVIGSASSSYPAYLIVNNGGTLNCGTNIVSYQDATRGANAYFMLLSGGTLIMGSPYGITSTVPPGATAGNIQLFANTTTIYRSFSSGANYVYNGTAAQVTGVFATTPTATTVKSFTIDNAAGVTLSQATTVTSSLTIGDITPNSIFSDGGFQVTSSGTLNLGTTPYVPISTITNASQFILGSTTATIFPTFATIKIGAGTTVGYASTAVQTVSGTPQYYNLSITGASTKALAAGVTTFGSVSIGSGSTLDVKAGAGNNFAMTVGGNWTNTGTFNGEQGAVTFNGGATNTQIESTTQSLLGGGGSFYNILHNNSDLVQLTGALTAGGTLINGISGQTGTGNFDANANTNTVTGLTTIYNGTYLASTNTQTLVGGLTISGTAAAFTGSTGNVAVGSSTVAGAVTLSSGTLTAPSGTFSVYGNWAQSGGTFTPGTNTVTFTAPSGKTQTISTGASGTAVANSAFNNIVHNQPGTLQILTGSAPLTTLGTFTNSSTGTFDANTFAHTVTGLTTVSGGSYLAGSGTQSHNGGLTVSGGTYTGSAGIVNATDVTLSSGTLTAPSGTFNVGGNWTNALTASFAANGGSVNFIGGTTIASSGVSGSYGLATQTISGAQSTTFNNLNIQSSTSTKLGVNIGLTGNLTVSTGTTGTIFDMATYTSNGASTKTLAVQGTGILRLSGTTGGQTGSNFPSGFTTYSLTQFSTTEYYDATTGQTVTAVPTYGNVTITNSSVKTAAAALTISNNMLINTGATFAAGSYTHNVAANWTNNGTFSAGTSTINFNSTGGPNTISGTLTGTSKFNYLTFNSPGGSGAWSFGNPADVGADFTLTNGSVNAPSGLLNVAGNWINNGGSFSGGSGTVSLNGGVAQAIKGSNSTAFNILNINNSAGLKDTLQVATTASTLSFAGAGKGYIDVSAFPLTLTTPSAITGASSTSYVITGNGTAAGSLIVKGVTASGFTFPIGVDSLGIKFYYLPATIAPVAASSGLTWSGQVFTPVTPTSVYGAAPYSGVAKSSIVNAEWVVEPTTPATATAALTLNWVAGVEGSVFYTYGNNIGISHYTGTSPSGAWQGATGVGNYASKTVTSTFTSFSPFAVGPKDDPLPVILVDFNAVLNNNKTVGLTWTTQQELNTSHFEVERSADGINWTSIGTVPAAGNSSLPTHYEFTDASPLSSNFYRIKMVNINNDFGYTTERFIKLLQVKEILVFPNPARNYVNVSVSKAEVDLNVKLINQIGQVMQVSQIKAGSGAVLTFDLHNYAQGTYFVQVSGSDGTMQTNKIIIMR